VTSVPDNPTGQPETGRLAMMRPCPTGMNECDCGGWEVTDTPAISVEAHEAAMTAQVEAVLAIIDAVNLWWPENEAHEMFVKGVHTACDRARAAVVAYQEGNQ
jgi:hypothetical protein